MSARERRLLADRQGCILALVEADPDPQWPDRLATALGWRVGIAHRVCLSLIRRGRLTLRPEGRVAVPHHAGGAERPPAAPPPALPPPERVVDGVTFAVLFDGRGPLQPGGVSSPSSLLGGVLRRRVTGG